MAADASQMMEGGKYPTSSLVLPCIAKVIESVDPATKILFPERTVDGHVTSTHKLISSNSYAWSCSNTKGSDKTMDFRT